MKKTILIKIKKTSSPSNSKVCFRKNIQILHTQIILILIIVDENTILYSIVQQWDKYVIIVKKLTFCCYVFKNNKKKIRSISIEKKNLITMSDEDCQINE
jgi:hypothetical protein